MDEGRILSTFVYFAYFNSYAYYRLKETCTNSLIIRIVALCYVTLLDGLYIYGFIFEDRFMETVKMLLLICGRFLGVHAYEIFRILENMLF